MTDRELLELAAKAVRLPECGWMGPAFMYVKDNRFTYWSPLTDDGDALRLAVKLRLRVDCYEDQVECLDGCEPFRIGRETFTNNFVCIEPVEPEGDPYAATRRAIVRAAAEIGKAMP